MSKFENEQMVFEFSTAFRGLGIAMEILFTQ